MVWTDPRVWVDGAQLTARQMNQVSDNLKETAPAKAQARGDIIYAIGPNEVARLPLGSNGQFLRANDGVLQWGPPLIFEGQHRVGELVVGGVGGVPTGLSSNRRGGVWHVLVASRSGQPHWETESDL